MRQTRDTILRACSVAELFLCPGFHQCNQAFRLDGSGADRDNTDSVLETVAAQRATERIQRSIARRAGDVVGVEPLSGQRGEIDHDAGTASQHETPGTG